MIDVLSESAAIDALLSSFVWADFVALLWFLVCWIGFTWFADHSRWSKEGMQAEIAKLRGAWMQQMLLRELRIVDTQAMSNLLQGNAFFASTAILAVGGLFALLGATEQAIQITEDLPFAITQSRVTWEVKVLLLIAVFVHAFFKFAWSYRLFNYCTIMVGAAPVEQPMSAEAQEFARRAAGLNGLAARHFNRGLRAYFFSLAALGWFVHPYLFMAATAWVVAVLYRREFRSHSLRLVREPLPPHDTY